MPNFPGPFSVEFKYQALTREHSSELNCVAIGNPPAGTPVASITLATKSGGSVPLQTGVQNFWNFYRTGHATATTLLEWILWRYTDGSYEKTFIASGTVTNPAGSAGTGTPAQQEIITLRSAGGGIMRVEWMENPTTSSQQFALIPSGSGASYQMVAAYLLSSEGWAIARDNGFPIAGLRVSRGQNEALWRKINRPNS